MVPVGNTLSRTKYIRAFSFRDSMYTRPVFRIPYGINTDFQARQKETFREYFESGNGKN